MPDIELDRETDELIEVPTTTNAATLPADVKAKLLEIRDHLIAEDVDEAYHVLYSIADPGFESLKPWRSLEQVEQKGGE